MQEKDQQVTGHSDESLAKVRSIIISYNLTFLIAGCRRYLEGTGS